LEVRCWLREVKEEDGKKERKIFVERRKWDKMSVKVTCQSRDGKEKGQVCLKERELE
jgi:hypothetical protein